MQSLLTISFLIFLYGCTSTDSRTIPKNERKTNGDLLPQKLIAEVLTTKNDLAFADTIPPSYSNIIFEKKETLNSAPGTKSVLFNTSGTKLYAMNLEGMSVYEFDQPTRKILREFKFRPTKGMGWDYEADTAISSYEEKPVEACFTNNDKILWVSLHNAGGIVPVFIDSFQYYPQKPDSIPAKHITVIYPASSQTDSFDVPLIKTGKTPKVISKTSDDKNLLVSNWHSNTVSILELNPSEYPYGKLIRTIPVAAIPRGIAVDDKNNKSYVAIMGGASITVVNNWVWQKEDEIQVASNPRHIVMDTSGRLFVSYNKLSQIACINTETGKTLFTAPTHAQPRTIALSKNKQFLFVTCYNGNMVDVFKINNNGFKKLYSIDCKGKPVGVDIFEDNNKLEAWVCTYTNGAINILSFKKN
ncbi:MAG: YncE family protein [Chitinophagales bacterium]